MFETKINGDLFTYESWELGNGTVSFPKTARHFSDLVFYNQSLYMSGREFLTTRQWAWHVACLESYRRSNA